MGKEETKTNVQQAKHSNKPQINRFNLFKHMYMKPPGCVRYYYFVVSSLFYPLPLPSAINIRTPPASLVYVLAHYTLLINRLQYQSLLVVLYCKRQTNSSSPLPPSLFSLERLICYCAMFDWP